MNNLPIITVPNEHLRQKSQEVPAAKISSPEIQALVDNLIETMREEKGVGIAAPQVDKSLRVIIAEHNGSPEVFINPELTSLSWSKIDSEEGCLSVPGINGIVRRHRSATFLAYDRKGQEINLKVAGFFCIILQHEIDHLNGILFTDRVVRYTSPRRSI